MRISLRSLGGLVMGLSVASCTIQKRVYMSGYHIEWKAFAKTSPQPFGTDITGYSLQAYDALSTKLSQESIIDATNPSTIYGVEGTLVHFPENAFVYENGSAIRCNQVAVYVTEFYAMSDIIASGLSTTDNKRLLASAGMVHIEARCHGEKLKLKPGKKLTVKMPAFPGDRSMKAFSGKLKDGIIDWKVDGKLALDNFQNGDPGPDGGSGGSGESERSAEGDYQETYVMSLTKLGWINCDRFYDTKEPVKFLVKADSVDKTVVALIFRDMKSVLPGYRLSNLSTEFSGVPKGANVTVLAYRIDPKTKDAVVGREDLIVGDTSLVQLAMQPMNAGEFKTMLKTFD